MSAKTMESFDIQPMSSNDKISVTHTQNFQRNLGMVRFALNIDGMSPFAKRSSKHSTWSVILTMYSLPSITFDPSLWPEG